MDATSIYTVIITIITVFGSASAWRFYEKRQAAKEKSENFMKDDCEKRITKLEILLTKASEEKDKMREEILKLTGQVAELKTKVEFLEKENRDLEVKRTKPAKRTHKP